MSLPRRQYAFSDGHWRDVWNSLVDDQPLDITSWLNPWPTSILADAWSLCGCMDWDDLAARVHAYLTQPGDIIHVDLTDLLAVLVASCADAARLTDHGGSIRSAWVNDAGRRWLELYARDLTDTAGET